LPAGGVLAAIALSAGPAAAQVSPPSCGKALPKSTGGYWACTFADEFGGTSLDRTKWGVMTTVGSGFTHADECFIDDPQTVAVASGSLRLTAAKLAAPIPCQQLETPYVSGMVHTRSTFAQTYGRFEARIKFPRGAGFHSAWWMWPRDGVYGAASGEIDIAEHYGSVPTLVSAFVHIKNGGTDRGKGTYCRVAFNERGFHRYAVEWLPLGGFKFIYDNRVCMTFDGWDPGEPLVYPQPFDQPFFMILTLALGLGTNAVSEDTRFPATMSVDYVRAWS
jgi:beta-glucanase (GH16 family)